MAIDTGRGVVVVSVQLFRAAANGGLTGEAARGLLAVAAFVPLVIFGIVALVAPLAIVLTPDAIVVRRVLRNVVIPLGEIREVRRIEGRDAHFVWRLWGSGRFLRFFGLFYSRSLGEFWAYAGKREDLVLLIRTDGRKIVISPYPPEPFIKAIQEAEGRLSPGWGLAGTVSRVP